MLEEVTEELVLEIEISVHYSISCFHFLSSSIHGLDDSL